MGSGNGGAAEPAGARRRARRRTRVLSVTAVAGITAAIAVMLAVCVAGPSRAVVRAPAGLSGPPWHLDAQVPTGTVAALLWAAVVCGGVGVSAGLAAVARGARPSARRLIAAAVLVTAAFTALPPAGSTDVLDYAAYGEIAATGHNPYLMTPRQLRLEGNPVGWAAPDVWLHRHSVYGPLATAEQAAAAEVAGPSALRITFWLKLWNSLFFIAVVLALDRTLRGDASRRARAHLWWSLNPLLLWHLVASGHVDTIAAALGVVGVMVLTAGPDGRGARPVRALAAGALVGAAADFKITFLLFGLGLAWAARRSPRALAAGAAGGLTVLVPSYLWFGTPALTTLQSRDASATSDNFYRLFARLAGLPGMPYSTVISLLLLAAIGWLLLRSLPAGPPSLPAVRPALAIALAWLLVWPFQRPWYDAMAICLLALYPATALDWPVLVRLSAVTFYTMPGLPNMPGVPGPPHGWLSDAGRAERTLAIPIIRLAVLAWVAVLCVRGGWAARRGPVLAGPAGPAAVNGGSSAWPPPQPAARARADAPPVPGSDGEDPPGTHPRGPG